MPKHRILLVLVAVLLLPALAGAEARVVGRAANGVPTFVTGDLGTLAVGAAGLFVGRDALQAVGRLVPRGVSAIVPTSGWRIYTVAASMPEIAPARYRLRVEGEVQVDHQGENAVLHPGDQVTTTLALAKVPVEQEIAWSRDFDQYLALLKEVRELSKEI